MTVKDFKLSCLFWLFVATSIRNTSGIKEATETDVIVTSDNGTDVTEIYLQPTMSRDCFKSLKFSDPELTHDSVERPKSLAMASFEYPRNGEIREGKRFLWQTPSDDASLHALKGFYLQIIWIRFLRVCRIYKFRRPVTEILNFNFSTEALLDRTNELRKYEIRVYSLPVDPQQQNNKRAYRRIVFGLKDPSDVIKYPGYWKPNISYGISWDQDLCRGSVNMSFEFPPQRQDWLLEYFDVTLHTLESALPYRNETIRKELNSNDTNHAHVHFDGLKDGFYYIKVRVVNHEKNLSNSSLCVCRKENNRCSTTCSSSMTEWFNLHGHRSKNPPEVVTPSAGCDGRKGGIILTTPTADETRQTVWLNQVKNAGNDDSKNVTIYIAAPAGVIIVLIFGLFGAIYLWRRKKDGGPLWRTKDGATDGLDKYLQRKTVYLIDVTDQAESILMVNRFRSFLKAHCHCSIIDPRDANLSQICESAWITSMIQKCDCIIFINSEEAANLVDAFLNSQKISLDPKHSFAHKALRIAFNANLNCQFTIVTFTEDWTKDRLAVLNPRKYILPKQLSAFMRGLHDLSKSAAEKLASHLPLTPSNMGNNLEWTKLLQAVKKLEAIEKKTVDINSSSFLTVSESDKKPMIMNVSDPPQSNGDDLNEDKKSMHCDYSETHSLQTALAPKYCESDDNGPKAQLSGFHVDNTMDWSSCYTVGIVSNIHPSEGTQENSNFLHSDDKPKKTSKSQHAANANREYDVSLTVIALKGTEIPEIISNEDSISNKQDQMNDDSSQWSSDAEYDSLTDSCCQANTGGELDRLSQHFSKDSVIIMPPNKSLPTDNISCRLRTLNEEVSGECPLSQQVTGSKLENAIIKPPNKSLPTDNIYQLQIKDLE